MSNESNLWLIASDVDGTVFDGALTVHPRTREAIAAARARGHMVTLATGRMYRATAPLAQELEITSPLICYQGALVRRLNEIWHHQALPLDIAHEAIEVARERGYHLNTYVDDTLFVERLSPELAIYTDLAPMAEPQAVGDLHAFLAHDPTKILFITPESEAEKFLQWAGAQWGARAQVVMSHPRFIELTHPAVSKGTAVMYLAHKLGIPRERVLTIGDNHNDISMIRAAGIGVAMGNASPEVQAYADWVAPPVGEGGLGAVLEKYVL